MDLPVVGDEGVQVGSSLNNEHFILLEEDVVILDAVLERPERERPDSIFGKYMTLSGRR